MLEKRSSGPVWAADGTELFYVGRVGDEYGLVTVAVTPEDGGLSFGRPTLLFSYATLDSTVGSGYANNTNVGTGFDVAPNGERFAAIRLNASGLGLVGELPHGLAVSCPAKIR